MGVVHKLKEEVVSFIIAQKTSNPSVSVRRLASLTSEQFQIKVSKSSVSAVLKNSALSSSVGRRSGARLRTEKFSIPSNKKNEISKKMIRAGFSKEMSLAGGNQSPAQLEETAGKEMQNVVRENIQNIDVQDEPMVDGMGFVFLKAAQWEISNKSLMGNLLKKYIKKPVSGHFDAVSDMFLFFRFLGIETMDRVSAYQQHGLWILNNFCGSSQNENNDMLELQELFQWAKAMKAPSLPSDFILDYNQEKDHAFLEIKGFKLLLEDESELIMDAAMISVGTNPMLLGDTQTSLPITKAMTWLSNYIVSNIQSPIFQKIPGETKFDRSFYEMVSVFENFPGKKILKVVVFNEKNEAVAEFSTIPSQKRNFLAGAGPQQKEFAELTKSVKWGAKKPFYHEGIDKILYFTETKSDYPAEQLRRSMPEFRVITMWDDKETAPYWAILTNQRKGNSEEMLAMYLSRWPYRDDMPSETSRFRYEQKEALFPDQILDNFSGIFNDFIEALHGYCQKHFFSENYSRINIRNSMPIIYDIPGCVDESQEAIKVFLKVAAVSPQRRDLEYAVRRVNEAHIFDYTGRRLWLEIVLC